MRILIATIHVNVVGGVESYLHDLLPALAARGHELALLSEQTASMNTCIADSVDHMPHWSVSQADWLARVNAWQPDVCLSQGLSDPALERLLIDRFPTVLYAHNYHGTCISGAKRHAFPRAEPCSRVLGVGCLAHYLPRRCGGFSPVTMWQQYRVQQARRALLSRYRRILVASAHMREEYLRSGMAAEHVAIAPLFAPGIVPDTEPPMANREWSGRLLFVGRLTNVKGATYAIQAMPPASRALDRTLKLIVAGDGPERARIEALAGRLGVCVDFRGWVNQTERARLMREADLLVVPSVWPEPFGLVGVEAGCVGLPAVAFDVGGIREWLVPGESGELAAGDPPRVAGFAAALVRALADPECWRRLRVGAWKKAAAFSREWHVTMLESILVECPRSQSAPESEPSRC